MVNEPEKTMEASTHVCKKKDNSNQPFCPRRNYTQYGAKPQTPSKTTEEQKSKLTDEEKAKEKNPN